MQVRNRLLLVKEEATYGNDASPQLTDAIEVKQNLKINHTGDHLERDNVRSNISAVSPVLGKRYTEVTFEVELKGSGQAGVANKIGDLLEACSFSETVKSGSCVIYKPTSSNKKSVTIYIYDIEGGSALLRKITGAVGNVVLKATAGQYATLSFTMRGLYNEPIDVTTPNTPTYESTLPPIVEDCSFSLDGVDDLIVQEITIDIGNEIAERPNISSANGIHSFGITSRKPKGKFNPEACLAATYDFYDDWVNSTPVSLSLTIGKDAGNIIEISAPKVTFDSIEDGERASQLTKEIPFSLGQDEGDDELTITFK